MILPTPVIHLLVASMLAAPPIDPATCGAADLRCTGRANLDAARLATSNEQKAKHLYRAHRAFLALADSGPAPQRVQDLCRAQQLLKQARKLAATSNLARIAASEVETAAKFKATGIECHSRKRGDPSDPRVASIADPGIDPPPLLPVEPRTPHPTVDITAGSTPVDAPSSRSPSDPTPALTSPPPRAPLPSVPHPSHHRWTPRAWAGLGTALLGAGLVAGMGGSLRGRRAANDVILAIDRDVEAANRTLTTDETLRVHDANLRWQRLTAVAIVTGTAGAVALLTGTVLMATGLRRRVDISPWGDRASAGLWIHGRF